MAFLYFFVTALLFGSNFKLMNEATIVFDPAIVTLGRLAGGAVVLLAAWQFGPQHWKIAPRERKWVIIAGLLGNAYPFLLIPFLLQLGVEHSFMAMFVPFTPLLTILVSLPLLGIRPTLRQVIGILGGLALLLVITTDGEKHGASTLFVVLALTVPLGYACANTLIRRELAHAPAMPLSAMITLVSMVAILPVAVWRCHDGVWSGSGPVSSDQFIRSLIALLVLGFLGTGVAVGMFVALIQRKGPLFAGMVTYMVPPIALIWGWMDGETITATQLGAIGGILAMVALVQYNPRFGRRVNDGEPDVVVA